MKGLPISHFMKMSRLLFIFIILSIIFSYPPARKANAQITSEQLQQLIETTEKDELSIRKDPSTGGQSTTAATAVQSKGASTAQSAGVTPSGTDDRQASTRAQTNPLPVIIQQSKIEQMFNDRFMINAKAPLEQYGYNYFKKFTRDKYIPVGDNYTVGPGDTLAIYFWGAPVDILKLQGFYTLQIDRDGKIFIPNLGVFYVWGLRVKDAKDVIDKSMAKKYRGYELEVTLGGLREFPVYVSGFVKQPGIVLATGTCTIMDVLALAGGVEKNGSLRNITIKRMEKTGPASIAIDLYTLLVKGNPLDIIVREGDAIYINPVNETAGISGCIKRPAIYELEKDKTAVKDLIEFGGGVLPSVHTPGIKLYRYVEDKLQILEGTLTDGAFLGQALKSGDYISIDDQFNLIENEILVKGRVSYPGKYSYKDGLKLSEIIKSVGTLPDTNMDTGGIWRDSENRVINFNPKEVLEGKTDVDLQKKDIVNFYPRRLNEPLQVMGEIENPGVIQYYIGVTLLDVFQNIKLKYPANELKAEIFLLDEMKDKPVTVYLSELLIGGAKDANLALLPGTRILVKKTEENERRKSLTVLGEVNRPGVFNYKNGLTLYDLLSMAGGYTDTAYPRGIILIRNSARKLQEEHIRISFMSMKENLGRQSAGVASGGSSPEEQAMLKMTIQRYEEMLVILQKKSELALGRVALDIPLTLEELKKSKENVKLIDGDFVYIPKKPNWVLVLGDVYNQMSLPYDSGKTVQFYMNQLGGMAENADNDNLYIIKANGKIISKQQYSSIKNLFFSIDWSRKKIDFAKDFESIKLEQGDTIVVPAALKVPIMWRPILKDIAQIMFQTMSTVIMATLIW